MNHTLDKLDFSSGELKDTLSLALKKENIFTLL